VDDIPAGWHLCNGEAGTVDLRDRYIVGAGGSYDPGATGGARELTVSGTVTVAGHAVTVDEMAAHVHPYTDKYNTTCSTNTYYPAGGPPTCARTTETGTTPSPAEGRSTATQDLMRR